MKKIKVLIVDDSVVFREMLARGIARDSQIEIIAKAKDPFDARDKILEYDPDVVTCDVEMPKMDGIEFVKRLMPQYPLPIIMVSSVSERVFDAMQAGAVDFVEKPLGRGRADVDDLVGRLIQKIKECAKAKVVTGPSQSQRVARAKEIDHHKLIAIGASTGGTDALTKVLKQLPTGIPGIVIVQHIPPVFSKMFADRLNIQTPFTVKEAQQGDIIKEDHVYIAPGDQHMEVYKQGALYKVRVFQGGKVTGHCPSVDVLFQSVAKVYKDRAVGAILTGMGQDGARGLLKMRQAGARTLGQNQKTSVVYGMPKVAFEIGAVEKQRPLSEIGRALFDLLK